MNEFDCIVIGAGAAGLGAARRLLQSGCTSLVLEARDRVGGRAWTVPTGTGWNADLGCGWLHSADRNPLTKIARESGFSIDENLPNWSGSGAGPKEIWRRAFEELDERIHSAWDGPDRSALAFLPSEMRSCGVLDAISSYVNGTELANVSARDLARYTDSGINWRVREGLGTLVASLARGLPVALGTPAERIERDASWLRIITPRGTLRCRCAIVAVPVSMLGPLVPEKAEAAEGLPLGFANKVYFALDRPEEYPSDFHVLGSTDRAGTASYQFRPHGRPLVEAFFGGTQARTLEAEGRAAMVAFAVEELSVLFGAKIRPRLRFLANSAWASDPWARGAYSYAKPGRADDRARLVEPIEGRLFFAGEACSPHAYSTAHGAYATGVGAAEAALSALARR